MHKLTNQYKSSIKKFEDYKIKAEGLIVELLIQNNLNYHKIESRVKDISRLDEKIYRKNEKYNSLHEVTDLIGIRVITYLEDDVDKVAEIIANEFTIDYENSIDKRKLESDRFGYKSLHYVITLTEERKNLTEYKRFKDIKIEVQIRSILQHAWAEIEHDIGYKSEHAIPDVFRRNFYRVAALLETADIEFVNIKTGLNNYENNIADNIEKHPENVEINSASIRSFIISNKTIKYIDEKISKNTGCILNEDDELIMAEFHVEKLIFLGIETILDLSVVLEKEKENIIKFAIDWVGKKHGGSFDKGIAIFYLCYVIVGIRNDIKLANSYYSTFISKNKQASNNGKEIIETYNKINNTVSSLLPITN